MCREGAVGHRGSRKTRMPIVLIDIGAFFGTMTPQKASFDQDFPFHADRLSLNFNTQSGFFRLSLALQSSAHLRRWVLGSEGPQTPLGFMGLGIQAIAQALMQKKGAFRGFHGVLRMGLGQFRV